MTLIRSDGGCWLFSLLLCVNVTVITTVDGDEKGLHDDSKLNTRYRDTGLDKMHGVPEGITHQ